MEQQKNDFVAFILTHGRPDSVHTFRTLRENGYTGPIVLIVDNEDKTVDRYIKNYGEENIYIFDKLEVSKTFDEFDNFDNRKAIVYARNVCFQVAEELGFKYFLQLDDDYMEFKFRINHNQDHPVGRFKIKKTLDEVFRVVLNYYKSIDVASIAFSQGGDWFGGETNFNKKPKRKAMNSFFCSTDRKFQFVGRINEDVNTYTSQQAKGLTFFTIPFIQLDQLQTQTNQSGMTDIYLSGGTYVKSFYTLICAPSCTEIIMMGRTNRRLHHKISWDNTAPMIISDIYKK